jgi:hypothetical protein
MSRHRKASPVWEYITSAGLFLGGVAGIVVAARWPFPRRKPEPLPDSELLAVADATREPRHERLVTDGELAALEASWNTPCREGGR